MHKDESILHFSIKLSSNKLLEYSIHHLESPSSWKNPCNLKKFKILHLSPYEPDYVFFLMIGLKTADIQFQIVISRMSLPIVSVFSICNAFNWAIKNGLSPTRCVNEYDFLLRETLGVLSPHEAVVTVVRISFLNTCVAYIHLHIFKTVPKINRIYSFILLLIVIYTDQLF